MGNLDQYKQLGATLLTILGTLLVANGTFTQAQWTSISSGLIAFAGAAVTLGSAVYLWWKQTHKNQLAAAGAVPGVTKISVYQPNASPGAIAALSDNSTDALKKVQAA